INRIQTRGFVALAQWPGLKSVNTLSLFGNYPGVEGAVAFAASPYLRGLTKLNLGADSLHAMAGLGPYQISAEGATALSRSTHLKQLSSLGLTGNRIGPTGATAIATSRRLPNLTELELCENEVGDAGALALASSPTLAHLTRLDLRYNAIG